MNLILASASPRRQELLKLFGVPFTVRVADIDETMDPEKPAADEVARVSRAKAMAVPRQPEDVVVAADTIVVCGGQVLGKPKDEQDTKCTTRYCSSNFTKILPELSFTPPPSSLVHSWKY